MKGKVVGWAVGALLFSTLTAGWAIDWTDIPVVQDGACEFRSSLWNSATARKHNLRSPQDAQSFAVRRAHERCKNGMTLLISTMHSGEAPTLESTLAVARALCRVEDIQQSQRIAFDRYYITDVRCVVSKISASEAPPSTAPLVKPAPS
jgi:hypothetical protein